MPAIMARLVIVTARSRPAAPSTAACFVAEPSRRRNSLNVIESRWHSAIATPTAMIVPVKDCRLSVV